MRTKRILIIDDMDANRYVLRKILGAQSNYTVLEAGNGEHGLALLDSSVDLVILDINLPDMTGFELLHLAEQKLGLGKLPAVINISATFMTGADKARGLNTGAKAYLTHPINPDEVLATITSLLKSSNRMQRIEQQRNAALVRSEALHNEKIMLERFMRSFSHDLRSPLAAAVMVTDLMKKNPQRRTDELLKVMEDNLKRIDQMVMNVLDISHVSMGGGLKLQGEALSLHQLLNEEISNLRYQVANPITLHMTEQDRQVSWDKQAFLRIIDNLIINAAKHGEAGSAINVELREDQQHVVLSVSNRGTLPAEVLSNLATPYFISTKSDTKGWGLGLPIVKALCESFGGTVAFSNRGAEVLIEVRLPPALPPLNS